MSFSFLIMTATSIAILGALSGLLGVLIQLRDQSLLGDAIAHAALPGIVIAFLLTGSNNPLILLVGGMLSAFFGVILAHAIPRYSPIKKDAALGIILSCFFGAGIAAISYAQKSGLGNAHQTLDKFLFGNASAMLHADLILITCVALIVFFLVWCVWRSITLVTFDQQFAQIVGCRVWVIDLLCLMLVVTTVVVGLQMAGVILTSALLLAPATAALRWTKKITTVVMLSMFFGASASIVGTMIGMYADTIPTGPLIVLVVTAIAALSLIRP